MTTNYFDFCGVDPTTIVVEPVPAYDKMADRFEAIIRYHTEKKATDDRQAKVNKVREEWAAKDLSATDIESFTAFRSFVNALPWTNDDGSAGSENVYKLAGLHQLLTNLTREVKEQLNYELNQAAFPSLQNQDYPGDYDDAKQIRVLAESVLNIARAQGKSITERKLAIPKGKRASDQGRDRRLRQAATTKVTFYVDDSIMPLDAHALARTVSDDKVRWTFHTLLDHLEKEHGVSLWEGWNDDDIDEPIVVNGHTITSKVTPV